MNVFDGRVCTANFNCLIRVDFCHNSQILDRNVISSYSNKVSVEPTITIRCIPTSVNSWITDATNS